MNNENNWRLEDFKHASHASTRRNSLKNDKAAELREEGKAAYEYDRHTDNSNNNGTIIMNHNSSKEATTMDTHNDDKATDMISQSNNNNGATISAHNDDKATDMTTNNITLDKLQKQQKETVDQKTPSELPQSFNSVKINLYGVSLEKSVKEAIKQRFGCHYNDEIKRYTCPSDNRITLSAYLEGEKIRFDLDWVNDPYHDLTQSEKKIEGLEKAKEITINNTLPYTEELKALTKDYNRIYETKHKARDFLDGKAMETPSDPKQKEHLEIIQKQAEKIVQAREKVQGIDNKVHTLESDNHKYNAGNTVYVGGIPKTITDMDSLDKRFAQLEAPCQPCVIINRRDAQPITDKDFAKRLNGEVIFSCTNPQGAPVFISARNYWLGNTHKHIYKSIVFTSKPVDNNTYNLFTGFGVKPKEGCCEKILQHIKKVICAGCDVKYHAMLKLLAWQMQNIGKPSRIIVALKSKIQQIGKGTFLADIMAVIYGNSGFVTSDLGQIITRFNDPVRGIAYAFLDEALFAGDRKSADALKSLATTTRMGIESKGLPTVQYPIAVNLFLATNHDDAAHIEEEDARYWILECNPFRSGDTEYFKLLYSEINNGGLEAFTYFLLNMDVSNFEPSRDVPKKNEAKNKMIQNSINPYDARKWLEDCCEAEMILGMPTKSKATEDLRWEPWSEGTKHTNGGYLTAYTTWQSTVRSPVKPKPTAANKLGVLLGLLGFDLRPQEGQKFRKLPSVNSCLENLKKMIEKA